MGPGITELGIGLITLFWAILRAAMYFWKGENTGGFLPSIKLVMYLMV